MVGKLEICKKRPEFRADQNSAPFIAKLIINSEKFGIKEFYPKISLKSFVLCSLEDFEYKDTD